MLSLSVSKSDLSRLLPPRRVFLSTFVESADLKVIEFLAARFADGELTPLEAGQFAVIALSHVTATRQVVDKARVSCW